jgi:hypothetical protein
MVHEQYAVGSLLLLGAIIVATLLILGVIVAFLRRPGDEAERSRLFEMGYYLPRRSSRWPQAFFCTAMGLGVPVVALGFAATSRAAPWTDVWVVACIISVAAIVGATIVASIVFFRPDASGQPVPMAPASLKPASDPDALDFAGRLGRN